MLSLLSRSMRISHSELGIWAGICHFRCVINSYRWTLTTHMTSAVMNSITLYMRTLESMKFITKGGMLPKVLLTGYFTFIFFFQTYDYKKKRPMTFSLCSSTKPFSYGIPWRRLLNLNLYRDLEAWFSWRFKLTFEFAIIVERISLLLRIFCLDWLFQSLQSWMITNGKCPLYLVKMRQQSRLHKEL